MDSAAALITFSPHQARTAAALLERLFPADENGPGVLAIGVVGYVDQALVGADADDAEAYRLGLGALDRVAGQRWGTPFAYGTPAEQDPLLAELERGEVTGWRVAVQRPFFQRLRAHLQEGLFADPAYGGKRDKMGWRVLGHPGVWLDNSAEENLSADPVTKDGAIQSLADVGYVLGGDRTEPETIPGSDPQRGTEPSLGKADVVLVGVGGIGGFIAPVLTRAGLRVVGPEAGPWRTLQDFLPDELGATYYCRGEMGPKFFSETPRWRRNADEATQALTFSLGRMMNGFGGSIVHYGAWLRRFHPHHLRLRSHAVERWGPRALPEGGTVADWPVPYDEIQPYFVQAERIVGVTGDEQTPFVPRSAPYPLPALRPFRLGELFTRATQAMGLHPHMVPVGMTSRAYEGRQAMTYTASNNGFGTWTGDKGQPALTTVPEALMTGNLDLRTHCRVLRVVTDADGWAWGSSTSMPLAIATSRRRTRSSSAPTPSRACACCSSQPTPSTRTGSGTTPARSASTS